MTAQNKATIKTYFETGDKPTESQFGNLIDSYIDIIGSCNNAQIVLTSGSNGDALKTFTGTGFVKTSAGTINTQNTIALTDLSTQAANTFLANSSSGVGTPAAIVLAVNELVGRGAGNIAPMPIGNGITVSANNTLKITTTQVSAATQAAQEAGAAIDVYTSPGRQQFHPSAAKAWINFNGTGTVAINSSYNVTSITDNGTGDYSINFTVNFSGSNQYTMGGCAGDTSDGGTGNLMRVICLRSNNTGVSPMTASSCRMSTVFADTSPVDCEVVSAEFHGDQ